MMRLFYEQIEKRAWNREKKQYVFILVNMLFFALIGLTCWLIAGQFLLKGLSWLICFIGYPAVFAGFFGGILYLYRKENFP